MSRMRRALDSARDQGEISHTLSNGWARAHWSSGAGESVGRLAAAGLCLAVGCGILLAPAGAVAQMSMGSLPEYPAITGGASETGLVPPASAVTIHDSDYTADYIPAIRTSSDGRVGMAYAPRANRSVWFQLFRPETHSEAVDQAGEPVDPNKSGFVSGGVALDVVDPDLGIDIVGDGSLRHLALCDGSSLLPGDTAQPRVCGDAQDRRDCYDLVVVASVMGPATGPPLVDLYRIPVTVEIADPKTASARIESLTAQWDDDSTTPALRINGTKSFFEPVFDRTGRLFVGRLGNAPGLPYANEIIDIVYGVAADDPDEPACDPGSWVEGLKPISHAHHDPEMWNGPVYTSTPRFGIAAYPIRDAEGNEIRDGDDIMATYPWMDREGNNLFFTTVHATLHWQDTSQSDVLQTRFPTRGAVFPLLGEFFSLDFANPSHQALLDMIVPNPIGQVGLWPWLSQFEQDSEKRGVAVAGLWTQGKMVLVDNRLTLTDYGLRPEDPIHREILLYEPGTDVEGIADGYARIGSGTSSGWLGPLAQPNIGFYPPPNFPGNPAVIDSLESLFAHHGDLTSGRPRDVVWTVGDGDAIADVVFDDWLNPDTFILSSMMATVTYEGSEPGLTNSNRMTYHDGFVETGTQFKGLGWGGAVHLQNAATALPDRWRVPPVGNGVGVRVEPIGRGGVEGRGVWLDGAASVTYEVEVQPQNVHARTWFAGVNLDARFDDDDAVRRILTFPDGTHVSLRGRSALLLRAANGKNVRTVALPPELALDPREWHHLGLRIEPGGMKGEVLVDGFPLDRWSCGSPQSEAGRKPGAFAGLVFVEPIECPSLFGMGPGEFTLGAAGSGADFRGWVDDLAVFAADPGWEVACNHAQGTLVRLGEGAPNELIEKAAAYPSWAHDELAQLLSDADTESEFLYLCFREPEPVETSLAALPLGTESLRQTLIFPESVQFVSGTPRPDSLANPFCHSCHMAGAFLGLGLDALVPKSINIEDDVRRQPSQHPMRVGGVIPANWLGTGLPPQAIEAMAEGYPLDVLVYPPPGP